jgi:hypothetical protein
LHDFVLNFVYSKTGKLAPRANATNPTHDVIIVNAFHPHSSFSWWQTIPGVLQIAIGFASSLDKHIILEVIGYHCALHRWSLACKHTCQSLPKMQYWFDNFTLGGCRTALPTGAR